MTFHFLGGQSTGLGFCNLGTLSPTLFLACDDNPTSLSITKTLPLTYRPTPLSFLHTTLRAKRAPWPCTCSSLKCIAQPHPHRFLLIRHEMLTKTEIT